MPSSSMGVTIRFRNGAWWLFINHRGTRRAKKVGDHETAKQVARQVRQALVAGDSGCSSQCPTNPSGPTPTPGSAA
jgi:hypothetical protein